MPLALELIVMDDGWSKGEALYDVVSSSHVTTDTLMHEGEEVSTHSS